KYSHLLPYLLLTVVELILFSANFKPGTHLVGWDNLFPEFDFQLNLHRDLHAVWQAYRSLGVIDNMAHASNVILDIMRWLISFFVSTEANRWVYMSCTHLVGGWGMYHLMYRRILAESSNIHERHTPKTTYIFASLCSAFLYQYGLGVIQQYFLPLEVFVHHFAALPWLVYYVLLAFEHGGRKEYFKLALVSLVATPQAHVPTVFIVWGMAFSVLLLNQLLTIQGNKPLAITRILITIVLLFGTNAFWFLPFAYSTITHANIVAASKASQMASNDLFYRNVKYGDLENILQMKGNLLDYGHLNYKTNINHYMFHPWLDHMNMWYGQVAIWFLMISSLFGLFVLLFKKDFKNSRVFAYLLIFTILMLGANIPLISNVQTTLRDHVSLFATVFRAVFTKFSILLNFTYGICFGVGIVYVQNFLQQIFPHKRRLTLHLYFAIVSLSLIVYSLPAFQGAFYYENLGVKIPPQYFSLMKYLKSQDPSKRVLLLPAPWYWQWWQPSWGTINSGFIWHGISQPITELAFTPWSDKNENLYWEFDQAINSNDHHSFEKLLLKYNIGFVMYDESIATHNGKKFDKPEFTTFLSRVSTLRSVFSEESIELYNVIEHTGSASILINPPNITPSYKYGNIDVPFAEIGNYVSSPTFPKTRIYPYRSLFSSQMPNAQEYTISEDSEFIIYESKLQDASNHSLYLNGVAQLKDDAGFQLPIQIWIDGKVLLDTALLEHVSNSGYISDINIQKNSILKVKVKKSDSFIYDAFSDNKFLAQNNNACEYQQNGMRELHRGTHEIRLTSLASENCIKADLPMISGRDAYVFFINTVGDSKRGLYLNFYDRTLDKSGFDTYLPTVVDAHDYRFIKSPQRS
ncbi:MAG: hypothetical protein EB127_18405, partial [Alphaproteobacteria bacterium]|nr:hypothetical protein [Alphaproteobacteria bacterium]